MSCERRPLPNGGYAIISGRTNGRPQKRFLCVACLAGGVKTTTATICDFVLTADKTCDKPMCNEHRHGRAGLDYCRDHV